MEDSPVRLLVQEEGRAARNVIAFNVPCDITQPESSKITRKPPSSPRTVQDAKKDDGRNSKRTCDVSSVDTRLRSASTGRDKKSELHARYWAFLFGNLQRAVDEIYQTCETDESVAECKEVILVLENFTRDFHSLIEWFRLKWEYESTPPPQRPTSLAWEVRKSSPGKVHHIAPVFDGGTPCKRHLSFDDGRSDRTDKSSEAEKNPNPSVAQKPLVEDKEETPTCESIPENTTIVTGVSVPKEPTFEPPEKEASTPLPESPREVEAVHIEPADPVKAEVPAQPADQAKANCEEQKSQPAEDIPISCDNQSEEEVPLKVSQSCQTDLELDDTSAETQTAKCADKAVGTTGTFTSTKTCPTASPLSLAKPVTSTSTFIRTSAVRSTVTSRNGPCSTASPVKTTTTTTSVAASRMSQNSSLKANLPYPGLKPQAASAATVKSVSPTTVPGGQKATPQITSHVPATTAGNGLVPSASKMSMASVVTRNIQSAANVVKKSPLKTPSAPNPRLTTARLPGSSRLVHRPQHSSSLDISKCPVPMLTRSRTIAEVVRPGRGFNQGFQNARPKTLSRQFSEGAANNKDRVYVTHSNSSYAINRSRHSISISNDHGHNKSSANTSDDDSHGWETVKARSRWRLGNTTSSHLKHRFNQPSCAMSLPALIVTDEATGGSLAYPETGSSTQLASSRRNLEKTAGQSAKKRRKSHEEKPNFTEPQSDGSKASNAKGKLVKPFDIKKVVKSVKSKVQSKNEKNEQLKTSASNEDSLIITKAPEPLVNGCEENSLLGNDVNFHKTAATSKSQEVEEKRKRIMPRKSSTLIIPQQGVITESSKTTAANDSNKQENKEKETKLVDDRINNHLDDTLEERNLFNEEELKSKQLYEEEAKLQQEINALEAADLEQVETDGDTNIGTEEEEDELLIDETHEDGDVDDDIPLEDRYENMLEGLSWAERMDTLEQLEALVARHPGRAQQLHQKLSCPSRSRISLPETLRRFQARQEKAQEKRERLLQLKSQRLRELLNKVGEVKAAQAQLTEDRRLRLEAKLKRAEENRNLHLRSIKRKAHDEEEKLKEIAFINELEAQNKRHDFLALCQEQEERLQGIHEERQRRQEEKAAKEAAVEERRKALEAERQEKLEKMQERRRRREERIGREQQEKEKERQELAREKARDREERLSALHAAQLATQEELQKKIQQKQQDSARRHEENMEHIRQRALESGALRSADDVAPNLAPYQSKKLCTICDVLIGSEVYLLSHMRGKNHQENAKKHEGERPNRDDLEAYSLRHIVDAPRDRIDQRVALDLERQRGLRKRCKKIRQRMAARGEDYESKRDAFQRIDSPNSARLRKCLKDVEKLISSQGIGRWPSNAITALERSMGEMNRILSKCNSADVQAFLHLNGFAVLSSILSLGLDIPPNMAPYLPDKCFATTCCVYSTACQDGPSNAQYVLFSNRIALVLDLLLYRLRNVVPEDLCGPWTPETLPVDSVACALMRLLTTVMTYADGDSALPATGREANSASGSVVSGVGNGAAGGDESVSTSVVCNDEVTIRTRDVVSYAVSTGIVDRLAMYCSAVRDPPRDYDDPVCQFLLAALNLLSALTERCGNIGANDPTGLGSALRATELVRAPSMLYALLLQRGGATRNAPPTNEPPAPPPLHRPQGELAAATFTLLHKVADLDLQLFQSVLGAEGISLQFRHIASHLLWMCAGRSDISSEHRTSERELLHSVIIVLGYFTVRHHENQMTIQSGHQPTVLHQLCSLPFPYFSQEPLTAILFPTLLACCEGNTETKAILEKELSYEVLDEFRSSPAGKRSRLLRLLEPQNENVKTSKSKTASTKPPTNTKTNQASRSSATKAQSAGPSTAPSKTKKAPAPSEPKVPLVKSVPSTKTPTPA